MADILQKVFSNDFLNKNISIVVKISVKFGTNGLMDNTSALVSAFGTLQNAYLWNQWMDFLQNFVELPRPVVVQHYEHLFAHLTHMGLPIQCFNRWSPSHHWLVKIALDQ